MADGPPARPTLAGLVVASAAPSSVYLSNSQRSCTQRQTARPDRAVPGGDREAAWERREARQQRAWRRKSLHPIHRER